MCKLRLWSLSFGPFSSHYDSSVVIYHSRAFYNINEPGHFKDTDDTY